MARIKPEQPKTNQLPGGIAFVYVDVFYDKDGKPLPYEEHIRRSQYQHECDRASYNFYYGFKDEK